MSTRKEKLMTKLKSKIHNLSNEMLVECLKQFGMGTLKNEEERLVRALMLDEYESRKGLEAVLILERLLEAAA